jgi:hypothetical protein
MKLTLALTLTLAFISATVCAEEPSSLFLQFNPHLAMFKDRKLNEDTCLLCHSVSPVSNPKDAGKRLCLNDSVDKLCGGCHRKDSHAGSAEHLVKPDDKILKRMKGWEEKTKEAIPLDDSGKIACVSCHDPHPSGVLKSLGVGNVQETKAAAEETAKKGKAAVLLEGVHSERVGRLLKPSAEDVNLGINSIPLTLRGGMDKDNICSICHEFK